MSWLTIAGSAQPGLEEDLAKRVSARMAEGKYATRDVAYITRLDRRPLGPDARVDPQTLDQLRVLCRTWDVDFITGAITSHRPVIGRVIVAAKKLLLPIVRVLLKDTLRKQRDFNAQVVELLANRVATKP